MPRLARRGAARLRRPGHPLPLPARAVPASACARALSLAPSRSGPIYEARSHHVLMSLCPALAAAAAQTPPRELGGEGPARRAARRPRLQTLRALGTRLGAGPGARGDELLRLASSTSLPHLPPPISLFCTHTTEGKKALSLLQEWYIFFYIFSSVSYIEPSKSTDVDLIITSYSWPLKYPFLNL